MKHAAKMSLGAVPMLISLELGLALLAGYFLAKFFSGPQVKQQGRFGSLVFDVSGYRVHLHHWVLSAAVLLVAFTLNVAVLGPSVFYGFLGGVMAQGIVNYEDWRQVVWRR